MCKCKRQEGFKLCESEKLVALSYKTARYMHMLHSSTLVQYYTTFCSKWDNTDTLNSKNFLRKYIKKLEITNKDFHLKSFIIGFVNKHDSSKTYLKTILF